MDNTAERLRFREYYRTFTDDDLMRLAMDENLVPAAREAMTDELEARGLRDLSSFKKRFAVEVAIARAEGVIGGLPSSALYDSVKDTSLLGRLAGPLGAILFFFTLAAIANDSMDLGRCGRYGRLVLVLDMFACHIFLMVLLRASGKR